MQTLETEKLIRLARHVSEIISSPGDLQKALEATVNLLSTVLDAESCSIMLLDPQEDVLTMAASSDIARDKWPEIKTHVGEGFAGEVARSGRPLLVRKVRETDRLDEERRRRYTSRSFICTPMKVKGQTIGVINVTNRRSGEPFSGEQLDVVVSLAHLVALAIENARLLVSAEAISRRLRDVLEGIGDGVIATDTQGKVLHHNEIALQYLGLKSGQCLGCQLDQVVPERLRSVFKELLERTLAERSHIHQEIEWKDRGSADEGTPLTLSTTPLYCDARGKLGGVVFVIHDMTLHHRLDELKRLDEAKNSFLAIISHELRTPLTSIKGATYLLRERLRDRLAPKNFELLKIIEQNSERLLQQIITLLDVVNIENQTASLTVQNVRLSSLASHCVERVRETAERKHVDVTEDYSDDPGPLALDEEKVTRAFDHLVDNAIKFTPHGGRVIVSTGRTDGEATISVRDSGSGIDPAMRERIFQKFVQAEGPLTRQTGGCGLGLYVARALAELHGGRIETENLEDGGCEFRLVFPPAGRRDASETDGRQDMHVVESPKAVGSS